MGEALLSSLGRVLLAIGFCLALGAGAAGCRQPPPGGSQDVKRSIRDVIAEEVPALMAQRGVVGVYEGLCAGRPCIRIMVVSRSRELVAKLPRRLAGYRVEVEETGEIRPLQGKR